MKKPGSSSIILTSLPYSLCKPWCLIQWHRLYLHLTSIPQCLEQISIISHAKNSTCRMTKKAKWMCIYLRFKPFSIASFLEVFKISFPVIPSLGLLVSISSNKFPALRPSFKYLVSTHLVLKHTQAVDSLY